MLPFTHPRCCRILNSETEKKKESFPRSFAQQRVSNNNVKFVLLILNPVKINKHKLGLETLKNAVHDKLSKGRFQKPIRGTRATLANQE